MHAFVIRNLSLYVYIITTDFSYLTDEDRIPPSCANPRSGAGAKSPASGGEREKGEDEQHLESSGGGIVLYPCSGLRSETQIYGELAEKNNFGNEIVHRFN